MFLFAIQQCLLIYITKVAFSFWYFPGATFFVISIIINIIGMFKANQPLNVTLFLINFFRTTHFHYAICYSLILIIVELTI